ncbi:MAG: acetate--CoA ligase family protein [Proteobacteria bacterium]|nr:acetate--CoA ligase family protein [Pseudomonadota bacterium]
MTEHRLTPLLAPASIAVVGASAREGAFGLDTLRNVRHDGFAGPVHPVNPAYPAIEGLTCYPSLAEIPGGVEHAILSVANAGVEAAMVDAIAAGVRSVTLFGSAYLEGDTGEPRLKDRLQAIAREAGLLICGANCMGFVNYESGTRSTWMPMPRDAWPDTGNIALISHSGTCFLALQFVDRRHRHNLCVSAGQELTVTAADYMDYALEQPSTRVIALFLETVREPEAFQAALEKAVARDIPVVALKVGKTAKSAALARSHSGALAGDDAAYEALFDHYGVMRVDTWDDLTATARVLSHHKRLAPGGISGIMDSGGARGMLIDLADRAGVPFSDISPETTARLAAELEYGLEPVNPTDVWGTGREWQKVFGKCLEALVEDEDSAMTALYTDFGYAGWDPTEHFDIAGRIDAATHKPVYLVQHWSRMQNQAAIETCLKHDIPVFEGTQTFLAAMRHAMDRRDRQAAGRGTPEPMPEPAVIAAWRERLAGGVAFDENDGLDLLDAFGIATPGRRIVRSAEEAVAAAAALGGAVALKTAEPGILHKSDVGGVRLDLASADAVRAAYQDMAGRLGPRCLVSAMVAPGVELASGIVVDAQFGPLVMVAAGGILIEVMKDRRFLMPPATRTDARRALDSLASRVLLDGVRGRPAADVEAVAATIARLANLASTLGDLLDELDVNPLIAGPGGCIAVDALVVPRQAG